ncbi:hypothetical protein ACFL5O_04405 [Myxococcota bacterium]
MARHDGLIVGAVIWLGAVFWVASCQDQTLNLFEGVSVEATGGNSGNSGNSGNTGGVFLDVVLEPMSSGGSMAAAPASGSQGGATSQAGGIRASRPVGHGGFTPVPPSFGGRDGSRLSGGLSPVATTSATTSATCQLCEEGRFCDEDKGECVVCTDKNTSACPPQMPFCSEGSCVNCRDARDCGRADAFVCLLNWCRPLCTPATEDEDCPDYLPHCETIHQWSLCSKCSPVAQDCADGEFCTEDGYCIPPMPISPSSSSPTSFTTTTSNHSTMGTAEGQ